MTVDVAPLHKPDLFNQSHSFHFTFKDSQQMTHTLIHNPFYTH